MPLGRRLVWRALQQAGRLMGLESGGEARALISASEPEIFKKIALEWIQAAAREIKIGVRSDSHCGTKRRDAAHLSVRRVSHSVA